MHDLLLMGIPNLITRQVTGVFWSFMVYPRLGVGRFLVNYCWLHSDATPKGRSRTKFSFAMKKTSSLLSKMASRNSVTNWNFFCDMIKYVPPRINRLLRQKIVYFKPR
jgi:hypothetical protein